jgi:hypothetical protein
MSVLCDLTDKVEIATDSNSNIISDSSETGNAKVTYHLKLCYAKYIAPTSWK